MATKTQLKSPQAQTRTARPQPPRQAITLETVRAIAPTEAKAERMSETFGLEPVHFPSIRESTEEHVVRIANELRDNLNDKAMAIFLQRVVGSFVSGAYGAAQFYGNKKSDALALHSRLLNDARDEDRGAVSGFEGKAERASTFAAEMGLQAYALFAAAEGAVHAYAHITGDDWKPYERDLSTAETVQGRSATAMQAALAD